MNVQAVVRELMAQYPGKPIKMLPEVNPTEIICEFDPKASHPEWSLAIAVIDRSEPHFHKRMTEIYRVVKGELVLHVGKDEFVVYEGQEWCIVPGKVHWAEGNETWVEVYCSPGYDPSDHHMAEI